MSQDAQAGYACDYCNKRQPMAYNEVKECCKGHEDLSEQIRGEPVSVCGKRHMNRLVSDSYGKAVVRSQTECTLLRTGYKENAVTAAETFRTAQTESFFGREDVQTVERLNDGVTTKQSRAYLKVDKRHPTKRA